MSVLDLVARVAAHYLEQAQSDDESAHREDQWVELVLQHSRDEDADDSSADCDRERCHSLGARWERAESDAHGREGVTRSVRERVQSKGLLGSHARSIGQRSAPAIETPRRRADLREGEFLCGNLKWRFLWMISQMSRHEKSCPRE